MPYTLEFLLSARKEWTKLSPRIQQRFTKKLVERLASPKVPSMALRGMENCYKIKLLADGYRLVYQVLDDRLVVSVVATGKRDKLAVYREAAQRIRPSTD
ncbi:MAG: type II toxin-antitoxin system RelE/ParE family toxin [Pseudomonadaceae bacterium]|jgi:mRNA interferase RelE/StbE|nr:type II toxin-antitoxin system RelE/ParE family toxin [Pseudomonadaceae bacterium]